MRKRKKSGVATCEDQDSLTENHEKSSFKKRNRMKKKKLEVAMNPGFTFYFDERGVCCYRKKADE